MTDILQSEIPGDLESDARLPGVRPLVGAGWVRVDDAYAGQMAHRRELLGSRRDSVLWQDPEAADAVRELFDETLRQLPPMGFELMQDTVVCPDGARIDLRSDEPLALLGRIVQEDLCLMQKRGEEHVLTGAVLCFPANWTLAEKAGKPLTRIHKPVAEYDAQLARRVQRLFDGVQVGRPLWRNNMLRYGDPALHQPAREDGPERDRPPAGEQAFVRAERQCIARLPRTQAVVFSIHTYVVRDPMP